MVTNKLFYYLYKYMSNSITEYFKSKQIIIIILRNKT